MNRLINLYSIKKQEKIQGFDNIEISDLPNIINHSIDNIYCGCLEYFDVDSAIQAAKEIGNKIRPSGLISLSFTNLKHISRQYFQNVLSDNDMLELIKDVRSILSVKQIEQIFEHNEAFQIVKIEHSSNFFKTHITIKRKGI
jgi:predicted SAM-dependent methyltransferase